MQLNERRKALGIDLYTLELQTGISTSTLQRLFKDPEQVKFGSVYAVAEALGMKLCAVV
ncbi:helix-turn-helix transcriptional regulator [Erwinia persicina]|nr:helix-turn-helix transcriptional regulator [Erwinia persicina]